MDYIETGEHVATFKMPIKKVLIKQFGIQKLVIVRTRLNGGVL